MNNTFRLFVSSTFSDFIKERAILNNEIFEKVSALLKRRGCGFQIVDLRWGINTESALNQNTLEICLDEINYCMSNSPKPNFLIMAGDRYGWVPLPSVVEATEFEKIIALCHDEEKKLLYKWYLLDENNIPKVYYLNRRSGEYVDDNIWYSEEEKLHAILEKRAKECSLKKEELVKYEASATEHEILKGLFGNEDIADNVIVLMREGYPEKDRDMTRTCELKRRIREKMEEDNLSENIITLDFNDEYYELMEQRVTELLIKNILSEFERLDGLKEEYIPGKLPEGMFCGRQEDINRLKNYVEGDDRGVYFLKGESGSGKTTLLKEFINFYREYDPNKEYEAELKEAKDKESLKEAWAATKRFMDKKSVDVFYVLFGENDIYNFYDCLKKLCIMITEEYDISLSEEINRYNISEMFSEAMGKTPTYSKTVIVIDGMDMFYDIGEVNVNVFPEELMKDVKIIVSSADEKIVEKFKQINDTEYHITGFSKEDAADSFYKMLSSRGRTLISEGQKALVEDCLSNGANPLSCKLLSDLAAGWHSGDYVENFVFDDYEMAKIHIFDMFRNCGHDENVVRYVLSYIAVAPFGITEDDLLTLLFTHKEIEESFAKEDRYNYKLKKLPFAILSRLLYDLKECIHHSMAKDSIIISFSHNIFRKVVLNEFKENCVSAENNLIRYYDAMDNYISKDGYPNIKKLMPIISLLKKKSMYKELEDIVSDVSFADALIKSGNLTELCDCYAELDEKGLLGIKGKKLFECVRNNSGTLDCYKNGLFSCAYGYGLTLEGGVLKNLPIKGERMNFDVKDEIFLSCNGEKYAVIRDEYIYIYRENTYRYFQSIHMDLLDYIMKENIISLVWTRDDRLAIVLDNEEIHVYDLSGDIPKFENKIKNINETETVKYSSEYNYLLVIRKNKLTAIDMETYEIVYAISGLGTKFFDINENEDEILWLMKNSKANRYDLKSGAIIKTESFRYPYLGEEESVCLFDKGIGVGIYNSYNTELRLLSGGKKKYMYFPETSEIKRFIKYGNCIVAVYENTIIKADMKDLSLSYINIPEISNAYCIGNAEALLVITATEMKKVTENDFLPLREKLYLSSNTVEASREMMIGFMLHMFKTNLVPDIKRESFRTLFRKNNSFFRYDMAKYSELYEEYLKDVTFMAFSNDSHVMLANEGTGKIRVYDGKGEELFLLKHLEFSVFDAIIDSEFSKDSKFLYILKTDGIIIIDVEKGKVISKFGFGGNPPKQVEFTEDGKIAFVKEGRFEFTVDKKIKHKYNKIRNEKYRTEEYEGFLYPCLSGAYLAERFMCYAYSDFDYAGNYKAVYRNGNDTLVLDNGIFKLNGKILENDYCDFDMIVKTEFEKGNSLFSSFVKSKNDLASKLIRKERKLFLVSYMLNSVIVFDEEKMSIEEARKWNGKITGINELTGGVEIYTETYPYKSTVMF
ncbi:MAG: DUF4062 domain-containing protein [Clostridia bacterium]|nr:DUF4062 domain-containing protein [Clostridia bacterium]